MCSFLTAEIVYNASVPEFTLDNFIFFGDLCGLQINDDFGGVYFTFFRSPPRIFNYSMDNDGSEDILILTDQQENIAVFGSLDDLNTEDFVLNRFTIHPNPVSNELFISSESLQIEKIKIYSISGKEILSLETKEKIIDVSTLSEGIYFVEVTFQEGIGIQKFIKS